MGIALSLRVAAELARVTVPLAAAAAIGRLTRSTVDDATHQFARRALEVLEVQLSVERLADLDPSRGVVYMFNHQSHLDLPILYASLPSPTIRLVARSARFEIPGWRRALRRLELIEVDRDDRGQAVEALGRAADLLRQGVCVAIAPEGARSRDGRIQGLEPDGFQLAIDTGAPIVPVAIRGTIDILPRGSRSMRAGVPVQVVVGAPIEASGGAVTTLQAEVEAFLRRHVES